MAYSAYYFRHRIHLGRFRDVLDWPLSKILATSPSPSINNQTWWETFASSPDIIDMSRNNRDIMSRVTCCLQCWQEPPHNKWTRLLAIFCPVRCSPRLANTSNQHPAVITITKYFLCVRNIFFVLRLNIFQSGWRGTAPSNDTFAGLYAGFWSGLNNNKQLAGGGYDCAGIISCLMLQTINRRSSIIMEKVPG